MTEREKRLGMALAKIMKYVSQVIDLAEGNAERRVLETIGDIADHALGNPSMADLDDLVRDGTHSKYCPACLKHHRIDVNCF